MIGVGQREQVSRRGYGEVGLLHNFPCYALLGGLANVGKATWQVKGSLGRLLAAAYHEDASLAVADESYESRTGVHKPLEPAVAALLALHRCHIKLVAAAAWAVEEFV